MLEVITPATTLDLTTVEQVNRELGLDTGENDALIAGYISAVSDSISKHCKRIFAAQEYEETFYLKQYKNEVLLSEYPVAEIASIIENDETLADDDARVNADTGAVIRRRNGDVCWWPAGTIIVTYTAGFSDDTSGAPSPPPAIERAAILLAAMSYRSRGRDPAVRSVQHGDASVSFGIGPFVNGEGMPPEIVALLRPYKDFRVR